MASTPKKSMTIHIPPALVQALTVNGKYDTIAENIRQFLAYKGEIRYHNLASLNQGISDCYKYALGLPVKEFTHWDQEARYTGLSLNKALISFLANAMASDPDCDFTLPLFTDGWGTQEYEKYLDVMPAAYQHQAPRLLVHQEGLDVLAERGLPRPFSVEMLSRAIMDYADECRHAGQDLRLDLSDYCFKTRHGAKQVNLKYPLPAVALNTLVMMAERSLLSNGSMLMKVLARKISLELVGEVFS